MRRSSRRNVLRPNRIDGVRRGRDQGSSVSTRSCLTTGVYCAPSLLFLDAFRCVLRLADMSRAFLRRDVLLPVTPKSVLLFIHFHHARLHRFTHRYVDMLRSGANQALLPAGEYDPVARQDLLATAEEYLKRATNLCQRVDMNAFRLKPQP